MQSGQKDLLNSHNWPSLVHCSTPPPSIVQAPPKALKLTVSPGSGAWTRPVTARGTRGPDPFQNHDASPRPRVCLGRLCVLCVSGQKCKHNSGICQIASQFPILWVHWVRGHYFCMGSGQNPVPCLYRMRNNGTCLAAPCWAAGWAGVCLQCQNYQCHCHCHHHHLCYVVQWSMVMVHYWTITLILDVDKGVAKC